MPAGTKVDRCYQKLKGKKGAREPVGSETGIATPATGAPTQDAEPQVDGTTPNSSGTASAEPAVSAPDSAHQVILIWWQELVNHPKMPPAWQQHPFVFPETEIENAAADLVARLKGLV